MLRPLIGITPGYDYEKNMLFAKYGYYEGINKAGGLAIILPVTDDMELLACAFDRCDGILLSGGPDIDAKFFGEENLPFNREISPYRDTMELMLVKMAVEHNKPVLGICRGIQVLNAAMGGTLYQDIESQVKDRPVLKHSQNAPVWYPTHRVILEEGSRIRECYGQDAAEVNSFHHQAVREPAPGFRVTARTSDGIIEAIEHRTHWFALGVQWHPETMWKQYPVHIRIFEAFVKAAGYAKI